jgi:hypothetical protein
MARGGNAEFEIRYVTRDGKDMTWKGTGEVAINYDAEYEDIDCGGYPMLFKSHQTIKVTLENVQNLKGTARIRREDVERITTSRTVKVDDFTFGAVAVARKKAGAPKEATFELKEDYSSDDSLMRKQKTVVFTWEEVI